MQLYEPEHLHESHSESTESPGHSTTQIYTPVNLMNKKRVISKLKLPVIDVSKEKDGKKEDDINE